ncbi:MAG: VPLPA-CTERM sorting domain-containing protein [Pseudomonadota bacterium]
MSFSIKHVVRAAIAASVVAAGSAHAAITLPSTGNGSLVLFVTNTVTQQVYARDLGLQVNSIISEGTGAGQTGTAGAYQTLDYSLGSITADTTLSNFLTGDLGNFVWGVLAGDSSSSGTSVSAPRRMVATAGDNLTWNPNSPTNIALQNASAASNTFMQTVSAALGSNSSVVTGIGTGPGQFDETQLENFFGYGVSIEGAVGVGNAQDFYLFASAGGSNGTASHIFQLNDLTLSATGTLASVASTEVPLPAAAWLFGSGLMGLAGIGRRRKKTA